MIDTTWLRALNKAANDIWDDDEVIAWWKSIGGEIETTTKNGRTEYIVFDDVGSHYTGNMEFLDDVAVCIRGIASTLVSEKFEYLLDTIDNLQIDAERAKAVA